MKRSPIISLALLLAAGSLAGQSLPMPKYDVTVTFDKKTDFTQFKSYRWDDGFQSFDKAVHQIVVDAVDRELKALGFEKRASAPADLSVKYQTLRRIDVDVNSKRSKDTGSLHSYDVGTLVLALYDPARKELFRARADKPIEIAEDKIQITIDQVVAQMFAKYPTRTAK